MAEKKGKDILEKIWDLFASIKLAIVAFALIGLSSIVGTLIEQNAPYEKNLAIISKMVGSSAAPMVYNVLYNLGFMDMYHSWWFTGFLLLFASNLIICSLDRFPPIWRLVNEPLKPLKDEHFKSFPIKHDFKVKAKPENVLEAIGRLGFRLNKEEGEKGSVQYYGQKGRYSRLGVYVTHLSIIIILLGAILGVYFGFKGFLNIPEGASYSMAFSRVPLTNDQFSERELIIDTFHRAGQNLQSTAARLGVDVESLQKRMKQLGVELLGFTVECEDFEVQFYGNSDMPKEFTSHLAVYEKGQKVMDKWIEVNDPLIYKGYYFYQSSYSMVTERETYLYKLRATSKSGQTAEFSLREGETLTIPGTGVTARVADFSPALTFDQSGRPYTYTDMMNNPAVMFEINEGGNTYNKWIARRYPQTWILTSGHMIEPVDIWGTQYTGLQVRKDPGVWIVYLGCLLMSVGLYVAFFMSHRKIWVRLKTEKGSTAVLVSATTNKSRESFRRKIDSVAARLQEGGQ